MLRNVFSDESQCFSCNWNPLHWLHSWRRSLRKVGKSATWDYMPFKRNFYSLHFNLHIKYASNKMCHVNEEEWCLYWRWHTFSVHKYDWQHAMLKLRRLKAKTTEYCELCAWYSIIDNTILPPKEILKHIHQQSTKSIRSAIDCSTTLRICVDFNKDLKFGQKDFRTNWKFEHFVIERGKCCNKK